ncbi:hypothetical protein CPAV1605_786 [seawater metagenome]|uniref:Prolyl 4-hydroxylase alpha subunit Fe(2+) 2OG dioxygenase domain-containing protein n=1 Tax=seawater metagenome TaxID=1561972 RepID=A0A5E8CIL8_9ZZZZ
MNLNKYTKNTFPYLFLEMEDCFTNETIKEFNDIITNKVEPYINTENYNGERTNGNNRYFFNNQSIKDYPNIEKVKDYLLSREAVKLIESLGGIDLNNSYLRMEAILDKKTFWLKKHVDIKEKLVSFLIYINDTNEPIENGTDIYKEDLTLFRSVPFKHNLGYMFFPSDNTWHGMEPGKNIKYRKSVLINYVTFKTDWQVKK